jgi:PAT family acetyl-CoA transporter-like MFS transporter 1
MLFFLYFTHGLCLGFYNEALTLFLLEKKVPAKGLALLSMQVYPFSFKFLLGPVIDYINCTRFGKFKSWILPAQLLFGIVQCISAPGIEHFINTQSVLPLFLTGLVSHALVVVQGVATDTWTLTLLPKCHFSYAATVKYIAQIIGNLFGYNLFVLLSKWTIYNIRPFRPMHTQFGIGICSILIALYVQLKAAREEPPKPVTDTETGTDRHKQPSLWLILWSFVSKKALVIIAVYWIIHRLGFGPFSIGPNMKLVDQGFSKENMTQIDTILLPFSIIVSVYIGDLLTGFSEWKMILIMMLLKQVDCALIFYIIQSFRAGSASSERSTYWLLMLEGVLATPINAIAFIASISLHNKIADVRVGATYLSILNALSNLGTDSSRTLAYFALEYVKFAPLCYAGFIYTFVFLALTSTLFYNTSNYPKSAWRIKEKFTCGDEEPEAIADNLKGPTGFLKVPQKD